MALRGAVDVLAAIAFPGVVKNYDLDQLPAALASSELPALVPALVPTRDGQETQNLQPLTFDGAKWFATLYVQHTLYWQAVGQGRPADWEPGLYTAIDNYLAKVALDEYLTSNLSEPLLLLNVIRGQFAYRASDDDPKTLKYEGARFIYRWRWEVTAG